MNNLKNRSSNSAQEFIYKSHGLQCKVNLIYTKSSGLTGNKHLLQGAMLFLFKQSVFGVKKSPVPHCFNSQKIAKWGNDEFFYTLARIIFTKKICREGGKREIQDAIVILLSIYQWLCHEMK